MPILTFAVLLTLIIANLSSPIMLRKIPSQNPNQNVLAAATEFPTQAPVPLKSPTPVLVYALPSQTEQILTQINNYRKSLRLGLFSLDSTLCSFAKIRSYEIKSDFSHKGFENRITNHTFPFGEYHFVAENIAETANPNQVFDLWKNSPGHDANMKSRATYGCVGQTGNFFALELWTP